MPMQETSLPAEATALKITANGRDYSILLDTDTFDRIGEGAINIPILPLCRGDEFVGEVLEGQWKKGWTGTWKAANPFTAILDSTNNLIELGGLSNVQNVWVYGWIDGHHPIVMMDETEVNVLLEVPTNTAAGANQAFTFRFFITKDKIVSQPNSENDFIKIEMDVTNGGLLLRIYTNIGGAGEALIFDGSTYDGEAVRAATGRVTIWRILFHDGVSGAASPEDVRHMHIYLKQGASRAAAEAATENELIDAATPAHASPYDISGFLFNVGYPAYEIGTEDDTANFKQDNDDEAMSDYLRVDYSPFSLKYDFADADVGKGDVELWDGDPDVSTSVQVFDEDHDFGTNDVYLQNGLIRLFIDRTGATLVQYGLKLFWYYGASWNQPFDQLWFNAVTNDKDLTYPTFERIESLSPERTIIKVRLHDTNAENEDYYLDARITLERGKYNLEIDNIDVFPDQDVKFWFLDTTPVRFGYVQDDEIGDDDIDVDGDNTTMTDNFLIAFDNDGEAVLGIVFTDEKPAGSATPSFLASDGGDLAIEDIDSTEIDITSVWVAVIPFSLIANLFIEAEDATLGGAAARYFTDPTGASTFIRAQSSNGADNTQTLTIYGDTAAGRATDTIALNGVAWVNGSVDFTRVYILDLDGVTAGNITVQGSDAGAVHIIPAGTTHEDNSVVLAAQNDVVYYPFTGVTDIPEGRFIAITRMQTNAATETTDFFVRDNTPAPDKYLNEENEKVSVTVDTTWTYYSLVFDISPDESGGDCRIWVAQPAIPTNTIYVDYFLIIPIGDGESFPQDLAHAAMRGYSKPKRLFIR